MGGKGSVVVFTLMVLIATTRGKIRKAKQNSLQNENMQEEPASAGSQLSDVFFLIEVMISPFTMVYSDKKILFFTFVLITSQFDDEHVYNGFLDSACKSWINRFPKVMIYTDRASVPGPKNEGSSCGPHIHFGKLNAIAPDSSRGGWWW